MCIDVSWQCLFEYTDPCEFRYAVHRVSSAQINPWQRLLPVLQEDTPQPPQPHAALHLTTLCSNVRWLRYITTSEGSAPSCVAQLIFYVSTHNTTRTQAFQSFTTTHPITRHRHFPRTTTHPAPAQRQGPWRWENTSDGKTRAHPAPQERRWTPAPRARPSSPIRRLQRHRLMMSRGEGPLATNHSSRINTPLKTALQAVAHPTHPHRQHNRNTCSSKAQHTTQHTSRATAACIRHGADSP